MAKDGDGKSIVFKIFDIRFNIKYETDDMKLFRQEFGDNFQLGHFHIRHILSRPNFPSDLLSGELSVHSIFTAEL